MVLPIPAPSFQMEESPWGGWKMSCLAPQVISHLTPNMDVTVSVQGNVCIPQKWLFPAIWDDLMECVNFAWKVHLSCNHKHLHPFVLFFICKRGSVWSRASSLFMVSICHVELCTVTCFAPGSKKAWLQLFFPPSSRGKNSCIQPDSIFFFKMLHLHPKQQDTLNPCTAWTTPLSGVPYTLRERFSSTGEESKEHPLQRNI